MCPFQFTGCQINCWLIHNNLSCSKSGTKEESDTFTLYHIYLYLVIYVFTTCFVVLLTQT